MDVSRFAGARLLEAAAGAPAADNNISIGWLSANLDSVAAVLHALRNTQGAQILDAADRHRSDIVLAVAEVIDDAFVDELTALADAATRPHQRIVLVSGRLQRRYLPRLFRAGVVCVLAHQDATPRRVIRAIFACARGEAVLPGQLTRWLLDEVRFGQRDVLASQDLAPGGLTPREVEVLKYIAEGDETSEVATKLNYSERTIKKILQDMLVRLRLHNRAHAVSYALRVGAI
ncbi:response regulator transcription factor [Lentzea sp. NPDC034063]|uniref:response regulator transcription factor n=1 Tax=unclassified Lentzea TaxID=2643253 RepID=UPI00341140B9